MRSDLYTSRNADLAEWKVQLLRHHRSQQQRNLRTRHIGFDYGVPKPRAGCGLRRRCRQAT